MVHLSSAGAPRPLILALHGSRDPRAWGVAEELRTAVSRRLPGLDVDLGWADVLTPTLTDTLARIGASVVVPVFLTTGYHVEVDLPDAVSASGGRAVLTSRVDGLVAAVADRLFEAGGPLDAVVLAAAGSSRAESLTEVRAAAVELAALVGRPVAAAFLTAASPTVAEAVSAFAATGARVSVASYLLAPGVFHLRLAGLAPVVSEPIGIHPALVASIVSRYAGATEAARAGVAA